MAGFDADAATMETTAPTTTTTPAPFGADDPRHVFGRAVAVGTATVAAVRPDQLDGPTPCSAMDVGTVLGHLVGVLDRISALGRGDDPFAVVESVDHGDWPGAWATAAHRVQAAWTDDVLARPMALPWQQGTGADILLGYVNEVVVHTWDLAVATGQRPVWDDDVLATALERMPALPPEGRLAMFEQIAADMGLPEVAVPFAEVVPAPDGAPAIDRLVAWNGRDPQWTPPRG